MREGWLDRSFNSNDLGSAPASPIENLPVIMNYKQAENCGSQCLLKEAVFNNDNKISQSDKHLNLSLSIFFHNYEALSKYQTQCTTETESVNKTDIVPN